MKEEPNEIEDAFTVLCECVSPPSIFEWDCHNEFSPQIVHVVAVVGEESITRTAVVEFVVDSRQIECLWLKRPRHSVD